MLSLEAHGFYNLMLDYLWIHDGALPADEIKLARLLRLDRRVLRRQLTGECSAYFFETSGVIRNRRVDKELAKAKENHKVLSDAGKAGAEARLQASNKHLHIQIPDTRIKNIDPNGSMSGKPDVAPKLNGHGNKDTARRVLSFLNEKTGREYRDTDANLNFIIARLKEGYDETACRQVIVRKCRQWKADDKMAEYLRPSTLFNREKFNQYAGELVAEGGS